MSFFKNTFSKAKAKLGIKADFSEAATKNVSNLVI